MGRLRVVVSGATGRMGRALAQLAAAREVELVGGVARAPVEPEVAAALGYPQIEGPEGAAPLLAAADVWIDFSAPPLLQQLLAAVPIDWNRAVVVGTTGLDEATLAALDALAVRCPVLRASNFSVGVHLLAEIAATAARVLTEADTEIVETHHRHKVDAPSGTALFLAEQVAAARGWAWPQARRDGRSGAVGPRPREEIGLHAVRGGEVIGEHRVLFLAPAERLELAHGVQDRAVFADGALRAGRWLVGRPPGRYTMRQVLGFEAT